MTDVALVSDGLELRAQLALPHPSAAGSRALVLCHGFPAGPRGAATSAETYPELGERLADDAGWPVLTFNFRGTGESQGDFSLPGWLADVGAAVDFLIGEGYAGVWVAGFSTGGALAVCAAAADERIRGVVTFAAPADFDAWAADAAGFVAHAREVGVIRTKGHPADLEAFAAELKHVRPMEAIARIPPRPILIVHGADDDDVPLSDARTLADAAGGRVELRVLAGAGHRLRHDPRAIAVLHGWLDRQVL